MYKEYLKSDLHCQLLEKKAKLDRYVEEVKSLYNEVEKNNSKCKDVVESFLGSLEESSIDLCK